MSDAAIRPERLQHPERVDELIDMVRAAYDDSSALYPIGGGTSLDFGLPMSRPGIGVDLTKLDKVIDYPAADMTVTVQAGIRMDDLERILGQHQQQLPLDVPRSDEATLGGVLATNFSGSRRLGYGTARDYVIGISAIDGRGTPFSGGGRVVKNVAGYDFCKLLIGSLGTIGIITEVTLKLKPQATCRRAIVLPPRDDEVLADVLAGLVTSQTQPVAADWLAGDAWQAFAKDQDWPEANASTGWVVLMYEGLVEEVDWMIEQIQTEWQTSHGECGTVLNRSQFDACFAQLKQFPALDAALVLKSNSRPSQVVPLVRQVMADVPDVSLMCHAASGIAVFRLPNFPTEGLSQTLTSRWQPAAAASNGNIVILSNPSGRESTRRAVWGAPSGPLTVMQRIKSAFDPKNILNPGRFVY